MRKDWEVKKLGDVATYINGYAFKPNQWSDTGIPIIRIQNLNDDDAQYNYCNNDNIPSKYLVNNGDILISWSASLGVYEWLKNTAYLNQHIFKVVFDKLEISKYYFRYAVSSKIDHMVRNAHGATMKHIVKKDFDNTKIYYPPLQTQQQIVEELDCLTSIIEKQKKQLNELDNLAQSIFYDMFGDPIVNEKGWDILNLNQIGNFKNGLNFRKREKGHSIKVLGVGDFKDNKEIRDFKHIETVEISDEISDDYLLKDEDIVFIRSNGSKDLVGRCIIVFPNMQEITFSGFCIRFRRSDDNYISLFLLYLFKNEPFKRYYINRSNGCNINNISQTTLSIIPIPSPPLSLQQQFASKIEAIEKQKELIKKSIKETEDLFNSRMDYYFN